MKTKLVLITLLVTVMTGLTVAQTDEEKFNNYLKLSEQGNARAQTNLTELFTNNKVNKYGYTNYTDWHDFMIATETEKYKNFSYFAKKYVEGKINEWQKKR